MKISDYLNTWTGLQAENKWSRVTIICLMLIILIMSVLLFKKETIVTIQPFSLTEEAFVTKSQSSQSYKEAWAWSLSQLLGNVTPSNVDFIKDRIKPLLSPRIYGEVIDALILQANQIKEDRVTMRFEPRTVEYELSSDKVFVFGHSFVKGASSEEQRNERTYEVTIQVSNYAPIITHVDTYKGRPRTANVLNKLKNRERIDENQ